MFVNLTKLLSLSAAKSVLAVRALPVVVGAEVTVRCVSSLMLATKNVIPLI